MSAHPRPHRRGLRSTAAVVIALVALLFGVAAPASAAPPTTQVQKYVALGDSYAAGQGASTPLDSCLRSTAAYPVLLDAEPRINLLRTAACSGATITDVASFQISQVNRGTTLVTLTVGANDLGVGDVYTVCAPDPASVACASAISSVQQTLASGIIAQNLTGLLGAIAERAPNAHIVVSDYPVPFVPGLPSPGGVTDLVNAATVALDGQIAAAVGAASAELSVELASVQFAYAGHQVGDADPWLGADPADALTFLHPTAAGQAVYRDAILTALAS
jgi:lysophospholipase L1-like esterase